MEIYEIECDIVTCVHNDGTYCKYKCTKDRSKIRVIDRCKDFEERMRWKENYDRYANS